MSPFSQIKVGFLHRKIRDFLPNSDTTRKLTEEKYSLLGTYVLYILYIE
jgi:hypothetical protein